MALELHCIDGAYFTRRTVGETKRILESHDALVAALRAAVADAPEPVVHHYLRRGEGCTELVRETITETWVEQARAALAALDKG